MFWQQTQPESKLHVAFLEGIYKKQCPTVFSSKTNRETKKLKSPLLWKILLPSDGTTHREVEHSRWTISHNFSRAMLSKHIPRPYLPCYCVTQSGPTAIFSSRVWKTPVGHKQKRLGTKSCFKDKQTCINARFPPINFHCRFAQSMFPTFALETKKIMNVWNIP